MNVNDFSCPPGGETGFWYFVLPGASGVPGVGVELEILEAWFLAI